MYNNTSVFVLPLITQQSLFAPRLESSSITYGDVSCGRSWCGIIFPDWADIDDPFFRDRQAFPVELNYYYYALRWTAGIRHATIDDTAPELQQTSTCSARRTHSLID